MQIAIPLYENLTALDAIGPYEVLSRIPGANVVFVGPEGATTVRTDTRMLGLSVDASFDDVSSPDVVLFPGGYGNRRLLDDDSPYIRWLRQVHETTTWTTSVCTGALFLGAAGLLDGLDATTHWAALERLRKYGAEPANERIVERGKIITAAGVSAGIDMALYLVGRECGEPLAQAIQLGIEYDPQPPFDSGSVAKAPPAALEALAGIAEELR